MFELLAYNTKLNENQNKKPSSVKEKNSKNGREGVRN